jgi:hypothetical protein
MSPVIFQRPEDGFWNWWGSGQVDSLSSETILIGNVGHFDRVPFRRGVGEDALNNGSLVLLPPVLD